MPDGLAFEEYTERAQARKRAEQGLLPAGLADDCVSIRYAVVRQGKVQMLGFEFKNEFSKRRWEKDEGYRQFVRVWGLIPRDLTVFLMLNEESPESLAAAELLRSFVYERIENAGKR